MTRRRLAYLAVLLAVAAVAAAAVVPATGSASDGRFYLALGDSLSTGYQPDPSGVGGESHAGYVNDVESYESRRLKRLRLVDLGCPGDTTTSLATGNGDFPLARRFHCDRSGGSQLAAAVAFLRAHHRRGEVPLITLDIGINDLNRCAALTAPNSCLRAGERAIAINTPRILRRLAAAAPKGAVLAQMTLYDTYLGKNPASQSPSPLEAVFLSATREANSTIRSDDAAAGFRTANVAGAYDVYDTSKVDWHGARFPQNLVRDCALTWACAAPPIGHNIHPNTRGYRVIARAFEQSVGRI